MPFPRTIYLTAHRGKVKFAGMSEYFGQLIEPVISDAIPYQTDLFPLLSCVAIDVSYLQWLLTMPELEAVERRRGLVLGHKGTKIHVRWDDGYETWSEGHGLKRSSLS